MSKRIIHDGNRRFWSGKVATLCGLVLDSDAKKSWWASVNCPACLRIKRGER